MVQSNDIYLLQKVAVFTNLEWAADYCYSQKTGITVLSEGKEENIVCRRAYKCERRS